VAWTHRKSTVTKTSLATAEDSAAELARASACPSLSFELVYREHAKSVARWALRLVGPGGDFEDVVQDVFLVVRRRLPEFRGDAEISTWLYEITARVAQRSRIRSRWWSWVTGRGTNPSRGRSGSLFAPPTEMSRDPHAALEARERTRLLYRLLDEIGETNRTAFILYEIEGLSGEQIAKITGTSPGAVWVRLSRARQRFFERLRAWEAREKKS
jgi:RNA polymerase sigma-70 factor (ECF subfamily)